MRTCFVPDCGHSTQNSTCGFTKFPKTPDRRKQRISRILRADRLPSSHSFVCTCHFEAGRKGIKRRKTPSIFRRQEGNRHSILGPRYNSSKRLLVLPEPVSSDTSTSFSSRLWSASVSRSDISHETVLACDDLGIPALGEEGNASVQLDDTFDVYPKSFPAHSSTPFPATLDVGGSREEVSNGAMPNIDLKPKRRTSLNERSTPSASHPSGWQIRGVEYDQSGVDTRKKPNTVVNTTTADAETQCLISTRGLDYAVKFTQTIGLEYAEESTQTFGRGATDKEAQTAPIMFDNADQFVSFGENLGVVKSLLVEVMEWRGKLIQAELKINALSAENNSKDQHIAKLTDESQAKDELIKLRDEQIKNLRMVNDGKHSTLLRSEKELQESLQEEKGRMLYRGISTIDARVAHFTGLPNAQVFEYLCCHFTMPLEYHYKWTVTALSRENQVFLTLMKLRRNFDDMDLAVWFNVSRVTVSNTFLTILDAMHQVIFLEALKAVPSRQKNNRSLPNCLKGFEDCRMIIDCTEVRTATPKSLAVKNIVFSSYKEAQTLKSLVGIAPNGALTYASALYPRSTSDKEIVEKCGILKVFERGDMILADKGIRDFLQPLGADLNIPPVLETPQSTSDQLTRTKVVARARIHVERAIQRIKDFLILSYVPITYWDISTKIFQVCAALTNFQTPLIREVEEKMKSITIDWDDIENDFDSLWWR